MDKGMETENKPEPIEMFYDIIPEEERGRKTILHPKVEDFPPIEMVSHGLERPTLSPSEIFNEILRGIHPIALIVGSFALGMLVAWLIF
jgi:hypothetical protein